MAEKEKAKYDQYLETSAKVIEEFASQAIEEGSLAGSEGTTVLRECRINNGIEVMKKHKQLLECLESAHAKIDGCQIDYPAIPGE